MNSTVQVKLVLGRDRHFIHCNRKAECMGKDEGSLVDVIVDRKLDLSKGFCQASTTEGKNK